MTERLILVRTCPWDEGRFAMAELSRERLESLGAGRVVLINDVAHNSLDTLLRAFRYQRSAGVITWHVEDDAGISSLWARLAARVEFEHPHAIIQGYSSERADETRGARWRRPPWGSSLCFRWPLYLVEPVLEFAETWEKPPNKKLRNCDDMLTDFLRDNGLRYWSCVPSLVTHVAGPSMRHNGRKWPERPSTVFIP